MRQIMNRHLSRVRDNGEAVSLTGTITFSECAYALTGQVSDIAVSMGAPHPLIATTTPRGGIVEVAKRRTGRQPKGRPNVGGQNSNDVRLRSSRVRPYDRSS